MRLYWKSKAGDQVPPRAPHARASGRAIESLLRHSRQTAALRFMQGRACAQAEVRLFYAFFRGSAAGLRLRVSGVTSTSVACVMNPASDVPRGLSRLEEHTSELQSLRHLVCRLLLEKK